MKITIKGNNPVTSDNVKRVIDDLNAEYARLGLQVKNMTCYIRFCDETGKVIEPVSNGHEIQKTYTIDSVKEVTDGK